MTSQFYVYHNLVNVIQDVYCVLQLSYYYTARAMFITYDYLMGR